MRKYVLTFISLFFITTLSFSQSAKNAEKLLLAGNFPDAIKAYEKLIEKDPEKAVYHMNLGECYLRTPDRNNMSIAALQKAVILFEKKNNSKGFLDAKFLLGKAYHANHMFEEAIRTYNELVINKEYKKYKSIAILENEIRASEAAIEEFKKKRKIKISSPGNAINTEYTQHSPFLIEDKGIFVYTSKEKTSFRTEKTEDGEYDENIFFINIDNENDKEPDPYSKPLNSKDNEASCWVSKDGTFMLVYKSGDIYTSQYSGNNWTKPEKFKAVNSKYSETHASMNQERNIVYFSSNRPGGKGGKDIYYIKKDKNGNWTDAKNLGKKINTKFDEESPYIHADGTLFFSSKGHNSIGGYDIFKSKGASPTKFGKPVNLGMPVNSVEDDIFYFETSDNKKAYFMSKRPEGKGRGDIFLVNYSDSSLYHLLVSGNVQSETGTECDVKISNIATKKRFFNQKTDGDFSANVDRDNNYFASAEAPEHFFEAFTFSAPYDDEIEKDLGNYNLDKINRGKVHKVYSLDFEEGSSDLNNENYLFLNVLSDFMSENNDLVVNISTKNGTDEKIAKKRKQNIIDYLKREGVTENMIYVDLLEYKNTDKDVLVTILDKQGANNAFTDVVDNTDTNQDDLDDGGISGVYTIQLGAFSRKISKEHRFFKDFRGKVKIRSGNDNLNHYTYGKYKFKSDAEKYLVTIHSMGFTDAFIREISWYK
ncbi:MAG: hypothetical protein L3J35_08600 [Bacteroidales bacterium]|nr:hypothetical protein [Bacteroidales bacterium]